MAATIYRREVARDLYLRVFDEFAVMVKDNPKDTQALVDFINRQFTTHGVEQAIVRDDVNGEYEVWQCAETYDSIERDQAEALFDAAWTAAHPTRSVKHVEIKGGSVDWSCYCGCGQQRRTRKTLFAPGHDARFASNLIKGARAGRISEHEAITRATDVSVKLGRKVNDALMAGRAPVGHNNHKTLAPTTDGVTYGTIKVERRVLPAQLFTHPSTNKPHVNINDTEDGSGDWLEGEGYNDKPVVYWVKRFKPNA